MAKRQDPFDRAVWTAVIVAASVLGVVGLAFQSLAATFRNKSSDMAVLTESRELWLGDLGILPVAILLVLLGFTAIGLRYLVGSLQVGLDKILKALAEILVRVSSTGSEIKETVRFT